MQTYHSTIIGCNKALSTLNLQQKRTFFNYINRLQTFEAHSPSLPHLSHSPLSFAIGLCGYCSSCPQAKLTTQPEGSELLIMPSNRGLISITPSSVLIAYCMSLLSLHTYSLIPSKAASLQQLPLSVFRPLWNMQKSHQ